MRRRRGTLVCATLGGVLALVGLGTAVAGGTAPLPKPGTATQVAKLVAESSSIVTLPTDLLPPLSEASSDDAGAYYGVAGQRCSGVTKCVFGDLTAKRTIVLFGDSHAQMWLPALVPVAQADGYRLSLVWESGCAAATVSVWDAGTHSVNAQCNRWRSEMIHQIQALDPAVVLLASRTSDIPGPRNRPLTYAAWLDGYEATVAELKSATTKVAIIGDITVFSPIELPACLAAYPTSVQRCSVKNPNGKTRHFFNAEKAAAAAEDVSYLETQQWLCTTTCSPVIGSMVAYYDSFHVAATYAEYLSGVWRAELKPLLEGSGTGT